MIDSHKPSIVIGSGGHAKVLIDILSLKSKKIIGFTDLIVKESFMNLKFLGDDSIIMNYHPDEIQLVNGIGSIGNNELRKRTYNKFHEMGYSFAKVIHPSAIIGSNVILEQGIQIMAGSIIQPFSKIGMNTIVNTKASIDHDCEIGSNVHIAPGVTLSGNVKVGNDVHIGTGASVINNISIGNEAIVGAGALVHMDVSPKKKVLGVPAREVE